jgi:hypothetical protein
VDRAVSVVGLLCRTSDRTFAHARGVQALAPLLGDQVGVEARMIGSPGEPAENDWSEDLRLSRGCLLEAGGQVDDAFTAGSFPVIVAGDCSIAMTTLRPSRATRPRPTSCGSTRTATSTRPARRRAAFSAACAWRRRAGAGTAG